MQTKLFIVILRYVVSLETIDHHRPAHVVFLDQHYAAGDFLISGAQTPRTGGVIIARGRSREEILKIMHQDPFYQEGLAEYQIFEFSPTKFAPGVEEFLGA